MTPRQIQVGLQVARAHREGRWYRAQSSGERVTLASLFRAGCLERRAWRGNEGEPDAAHEYHLAPAMAKAAGI